MTDALAPLLAQAGPAADLLRLLANGNRLQILCLLAGGERQVSEFESLLGIRQPGLSQQLAHLREARLVATRRVAKAVFYRLADDRIGLVLNALQQAICGVAGAAPPAAEAGSTGERRAFTPSSECSMFSVILDDKT